MYMILWEDLKIKGKEISLQVTGRLVYSWILIEEVSDVLLLLKARVLSKHVWCQETDKVLRMREGGQNMNLFTVYLRSVGRVCLFPDPTEFSQIKELLSSTCRQEYSHVAAIGTGWRICGTQEKLIVLESKHRGWWSREVQALSGESLCWLREVSVWQDEHQKNGETVQSSEEPNSKRQGKQCPPYINAHMSCCFLIIYLTNVVDISEGVGCYSTLKNDLRQLTMV